MPENQTEIAKNAFLKHQEVADKSLESLIPGIEKSGEILLDVAKNNRFMFACGNGGSAADSQHLVGEWVCRYKDDRKPLRAVALSVDTSVLTAIGNDYGYEEIFKRQVEALGNEGDVLVVFSTSGTSPNVVKAVEQAKKQKLTIIALTGQRGVELNRLADVAVVVPSIETARIQEIHKIIIHIWCEYIDSNLKP